MNGQEVLAELKHGNERYAGSLGMHPRQSAVHRRETSTGQSPKAAVLGCADSRVPPELIFDQGLGDLFVIRVAGNVLDDLILASLEYAVEHLEVPLVVVLGHSTCGAVTAALAEDVGEGRLHSLIAAIETGSASPGETEAEAVERATRANMRKVAAGIRSAGARFTERIKAGELDVVEAYYDLPSGEVEFLP